MTQDGTWVDESDWQLDDSEIAESGAAPVVAVVGRPNVGKSTLVNRILGRREAVVQDIPGVTRDRVCYDALWTGRRFVVQDTGGWEPNAKGLQRLVAEQASVAMRTADAVILVVDARGQSHSVAALLHGFSTFDTATRIAGVILNRVGSARHEQVLRQACDQAGVAVLGAIPRTAELELPTRYLGLVTAVEYGRRARLAVQAMTAVVARHVDLAAVIACAGSQAAHPPWDPVIAVGNTARQPATVAIAAGRAFTFGYAEHAEMLRAAGAEVVEFDPLSETLPEGTDAVVLPGGFPEQFTAELSANDTVRRQINELAAAGAPVHAECAGLLYLVSELDGHPMCGVVAGSARFTQHLKLGYRDAVAVVDSALYSVGERVVGHEFHRTAVTFADSYQPAWVYQGQDVDDVRDGAVHSGVHASYLHTHPAATPGAVARFVAHAACNTPRA